MEVLAAEEITGWIDGGWGVDALLGEQTRQHNDLDLVVDHADAALLIARLRVDGFAVLRDELPVRIEFHHPDGRRVDLHPITLTADGGGDQMQPDGRSWHYGAPTVGDVGGHQVPCCDVDTQFRAHVGYEPNANNVADMKRLAAHFGRPLPPEYADR